MCMQPALSKIAQGKLHSEYHRVFVSGTRSEMGKLKNTVKFGPIQEWRSGKVPTYVLPFVSDFQLCSVLYV